MFGSVRSLDYSLLGNKLVIKNACESFVSNDKLATLRIEYIKNPDSVRDSD